MIVNINDFKIDIQKVISEDAPDWDEDVKILRCPECGYRCNYLVEHNIPWGEPLSQKETAQKAEITDFFGDSSPQIIKETETQNLKRKVRNLIDFAHSKNQSEKFFAFKDKKDRDDGYELQTNFKALTHKIQFELLELVFSRISRSRTTPRTNPT